MNLTNNVKKQEIKTLLFDIDGCLYDLANGYIHRIRQNIFDFMYLKGFASQEEKNAEQIWKPLFTKYNQTQRGFRAAGFDFDDAEYWEFIRQGDDEYIHRDDELRRWLLSLPQKKFVMTNCSIKEGKKVLQLLGVEDCFEGVFGSDSYLGACKPELSAFDIVLKELGITDPSTVCYFEDSLKNLITGRQLGMMTVLVHSLTLHEELEQEKNKNTNKNEYKNMIDLVVKSLSCVTDQEKILSAIDTWHL